MTQKPMTLEKWEQLRDNPNKIDWFLLSRCYRLPEAFIREFQDYVDWIEVSLEQKLSEAFVEEFADRIEWGDIWGNDFSEAFILKHIKKVCWCCIFKKTYISDDFIVQHVVDFSYLHRNNIILKLRDNSFRDSERILQAYDMYQLLV